MVDRGGVGGLVVVEGGLGLGLVVLGVLGLEDLDGHGIGLGVLADEGVVTVHRVVGDENGADGDETRDDYNQCRGTHWAILPCGNDTRFTVRVAARTDCLV